MEAMTRSLAARVREGLAAGGIDASRDPAAVRALIERAIDRHVPDLLPSARAQIEADLMDDICGLGPLQVLMDDPSVEEIWINAASRVFVARGGVAELTSLILTDEDVRALVERMLHHSGRRLDLSSPFVDAMLAGGERLHVVIPPVTGSSWSVNIRKHIQRARTLEDLVAVEMVAPPMRDFLSAAVSCGLSVLVSGGTQAGKTTLLRALAGELPRSRRVISCEEVFELGLANWDHVAMQTRPAGAEGTGEITLRDLVRESLRMRPEYLIVGEVRGPEALDKLSILPLLAGENVTTGFVTPTLASSIDLVCHVERGADGHRHIAEILAVPGRVEGNRIETASLFTYDGIRCERGSGGLDLHDRFAAAGFDLASLLEWGTA